MSLLKPGVIKQHKPNSCSALEFTAFRLEKVLYLADGKDSTTHEYIDRKLREVCECLVFKSFMYSADSTGI